MRRSQRLRDGRCVSSRRVSMAEMMMRYYNAGAVSEYKPCEHARVDTYTGNVSIWVLSVRAGFLYENRMNICWSLMIHLTYSLFQVFHFAGKESRPNRWQHLEATSCLQAKRPSVSSARQLGAATEMLIKLLDSLVLGPISYGSEYIITLLLEDKRLLRCFLTFGSHGGRIGLPTLAKCQAATQLSRSLLRMENYCLYLANVPRARCFVQR